MTTSSDIDSDYSLMNTIYTIHDIESPNKILPITINVYNLDDSGHGSLREAIILANKARNNVIITFSVSGKITLLSDLPILNNQITIDGTSAPNYIISNPPLVTIDSNQNNGIILLNNKNSIIDALEITNSQFNGINILDSSDIKIVNCYIHKNNLNGINIINSNNCIIGENTSLSSTFISNVISNNKNNGIFISNSINNNIKDNYIGLNYYGHESGNLENGIWITNNSSNNIIGGKIFKNSNGEVNNPTGTEATVPPVFIKVPECNVISGNHRNGVLIDSDSKNNILYSNYIGTDSSGTNAIPNLFDGVHISNANYNSLIGCEVYNNPFVFYNVISGNEKNGLHITDSSNTIVQGNFFGINKTNDGLLPNKLNGILIDGKSSYTTIGGVIPLGNVCAGNGLNGIYVTDNSSNFITFNTFGGLYAFGGAAPNSENGIKIDSLGLSNKISYNTQDLTRTNVFSGNLKNGIELSGNTLGVTVDPIIAGLNTKGNGSLPNGENGLFIGGTSHNNIIGGNIKSIIPTNAFSGNTQNGILLGENSYNNIVLNCYCGTDVVGKSSVPNKLNGIKIADNSSNNIIGDLNFSNNFNIISGNKEFGVKITEKAENNKIVNNIIGLSITKDSLPNGIGNFNPGIINNTTSPNTT